MYASPHELPADVCFDATIEDLDLDRASFYALAEHFASRPDFALLDTRTDTDGWDGCSFFSFAPFGRLTAKGSSVRLEMGGRDVALVANPFEILGRLLGRMHEHAPTDQRALPFLGGAIGYLAYEAGRQIEVLPETALDDVALPDCYWSLYNFAVALHHTSGGVFLSHLAAPEGMLGMPKKAVRAELDRALAVTRTGRPSNRGAVAQRRAWPDLPKAGYIDAVRRIKDYIVAGDVYQVNMTQRFRVDVGDLPRWQLYEQLSKINPAPFAAYLNCKGATVVSSSPELFLRVRDREVETRPIKGTIRRGATPDEDAQNRAALLSSAKNRAELAMIVDLMRNDLGRVCAPGTVSVQAFPVLESYASVHHLVATIVGELAPDRTIIDLLTATFPGGSITGAPKIRAMEIIDELEVVARGIYTGSIGYVAFDGRSDLNIAIRTLIVKDGVAYVHAGGGVVADSDEKEEYEESMLKASKLFQALGVIYNAQAASEQNHRNTIPQG